MVFSLLGACRKLSLPIVGEKILVKFHFTNQNIIPSGIRLVPRIEESIETKHLAEGQRQGLPNAGWEAKRPDRVDTGKHQEFRNVDVASTWEQLKKDYQITDAHCFSQERSTGMKKPVIVVTFSKNQATNIKPKESLIQAIETTFVKGSTWGVVHHWINPNDTTTINCLQRQPKSP